MTCFVCGSDKWKNMDKYRLKPQDMCMCETCGVVAYPTKYQSAEQIKEHYRKSYRKAPNVSNLWTGERKLHYHEAFMGQVFAEWKAEGRNPVVGEVGSAFGMFLNWLRSYHFPNGEFHGTELTTTYRRVAFHEFGLKLTEELPVKDYDLLVSYHVLEHMQDPDKELVKYASMLKPGGLFYLSTPIWFREATNFGASGFDIEYYWAPDHINCWGEEHLDFIIAKAKFEVVKKNVDIYGNTYLLRYNPDLAVPVLDSTLPAKCEQKIKSLFNCWKAIQEGDTALAIEAYPNCPIAWVNHYEQNRKQMHDDGFEKINEQFLKRAVKACPNTADSLTFAGDISARYDQLDLAIEYLQAALARKPNNPTILMAIANAFRNKGAKETDPVKQKEFFTESLNICRFVRESSLELSGTATTFAYHDAAQLPFDGE